MNNNNVWEVRIRESWGTFSKWFPSKEIAEQFLINIKFFESFHVNPEIQTFFVVIEN
jgi:hypothetical protein